MCEMQKCPICGELIKKGNGHHIKKCMDNFIDNLSEDKKNEYVSLYNSGVSIYELSTILNFSYNATVKFLKKIGITKFRTISEQKLTDHTKNKAKQTYLKHFGCEHNFCKNSESRKEWEQRLLDTEGIANVFQRESVKHKSKETLLKNYIFELQGDYWHASPLKYKANDIVHYPNNVQYTAQFIWDKDKYKKNVAEFNGYTVFYIWEHDMNNKDKWEFIKKCFKRYAEIENNWN